MAHFDKAHDSAKDKLDPTTTFKFFSTRIKKSADIVKSAYPPFLDRKMVRFLYDVLLKTGVVSDSIRFWGRKTANIKTWINFQTFMTAQ